MFFDALSISLPKSCQVCGRTTTHPVLCHRCCLPPIIQTGLRCMRCFAPYEPHQATGVTTVPQTRSVCDACSYSHSPIACQRHLWHYEGQVREGLRAMKFGGGEALVVWFATILAKHGPAQFDDRTWSLIGFIPANPARLKNRGFDQSLVLAQYMSESLSIPLARRLFARPRACAAQADTPHKQRNRNAKASIAIKEPPPPGARILLIDDICTTGASLRQAAMLLTQHSAVRVDTLSLARAHAWQEFQLSQEA